MTAGIRLRASSGSISPFPPEPGLLPARPSHALGRPRSIPRRPASCRGRVGARGSQPRTPRHRTISRLSRATCRDQSGRSGRPRGGPGGCVRDRLDVANGVVERLTCRRVRRSEVIGSLGREARHGVIGGGQQCGEPGSLGSRYVLSLVAGCLPHRRIRNLELAGLLSAPSAARSPSSALDTPRRHLPLRRRVCRAERGSRSNGDSVADGPRTRPACDPRNPTRRWIRDSAASSSTSNPVGRPPTSAGGTCSSPNYILRLWPRGLGASSLQRTTTGRLRCSTR